MVIRERYSHAIADNQKKMKRKEADVRIELRASRTDEQQIQKLERGGFAATREKRKLRKRIKNRKNVQG